MKYSKSILFALTTGLGFYLLPPIWAVILFVVPMTGYALHKQFTVGAEPTAVPHPVPIELQTWPSPKGDRLETPQEQIHRICSEEIPELAQSFPYASYYKENFTEEDNGQWTFDFECNFTTGRFLASTTGKNPEEAYALGRHMITRQIRDWHEIRFEETAQAIVAVKPPAEATRVLIVDDDYDLAMAMQIYLKKLGYQTEVATQHEDLHRRIISGHTDIILLDWQLNNDVTADSVVVRATRLIDAFSDLRDKFMAKKPLIVTHSVLDKSEFTLPAEGKKYFTYLDHWQKPLPFDEVVARASKLLTIQ